MNSFVEKLRDVYEDSIYQFVDAFDIKLRIDPELTSCFTRVVLDD